MRTLNLGILAHVDAGKTTLTERLLFTAGAIDRVGSVDAGTTQTDSLELERERGITIRSAVASFLVGDLAVNLVDTPGHPDFIAEVERVLGILDGAVLVVSAVEGVQPQTPLLFRALQRLHVPTLIFVNKIDRAGADAQRVLEAMARRLSPAVVPMGIVRDAGRREASFVPFAPDDEASRSALTEVLADRDDSILRAFVRDEAALSPARLREQLGAQVRLGWVYPVYFGSAAMGAGIDELLAGVDELLSGRSVATRRPRSRAVCSRSNERRGASASPTSACSPGRSDRASGYASGEGRRRSQRRSRCSRRPIRRGATSWPPARWRRSAVSARSGSATRSAHRPRARRRPLASCVQRWRRSCSRSARAGRQPPRGPRTARGAGPAHQRPPG